jgi:hypothetical protein
LPEVLRTMVGMAYCIDRVTFNCLIVHTEHRSAYNVAVGHALPPCHSAQTALQHTSVSRPSFSQHRCVSVYYCNDV